MAMKFLEATAENIAAYRKAAGKYPDLEKDIKAIQLKAGQAYATRLYRDSKGKIGLVVPWLLCGVFG